MMDLLVIDCSFLMSPPSAKACGNPTTILVIFKATFVDYRELCKGQIGEIIHIYWATQKQYL